MGENKTIAFKGDFFDGEFHQSENPDGDWESVSPADFSDTVLKLEYKHDHVGLACKAARKAFYDWSDKSMDERKEYLLRLKEIYVSHKDELAEIISRETGKPLWEAKTEAGAMAGKIDITINHSIKHVETTYVENALPGVRGVVHFKPRGAMAVVGPFNFPGHLPNGHIIPALLAGNTVVFKPSDKTPAVGQFMAELFAKAEFPAGVFNMVQGKGDAGRKLVINENIEGVLFTGSYEVGLKIKQDTMHHFWKILALEMGGKNATVVWDDADFDKAVYETLIGAYLTSGQRCSCTSRVILHKGIRDKFIEKFYEAAKKIKIGHWSEDVFMGPLISADSVEKYLRFQEIAKREDTEQLMRGKVLETDFKGNYVTPSINVIKQFNPESIYQKSEIFGPNVAIYTVDDFDQALKVVNASSYGLALAVFSKNKELYEKAVKRARVGLVNWNRTTNGASSRLPFGGMGKSGNDRPSADFAINYCAVPVASLEDEGAFDPNKLMPGIEL
jgi:succinylglutamic semialdehyde dehydrogenase